MTQIQRVTSWFSRALAEMLAGLRPLLISSMRDKPSPPPSLSGLSGAQQVRLLRRSKTLQLSDSEVERSGAAHSSESGSGPAGGFPTRAVLILAVCMGVHSFTFVSLFPYVGIMVKECLKLDSIDEAGNKHQILLSYVCRLFISLSEIPTAFIRVNTSATSCTHSQTCKVQSPSRGRASLAWEPS